MQSVTNKEVQILEMNIEDYDEVYPLWLATPGMGLNTLDDSREGIRRFLTRNPHTCFVARKTSLVGVILCGHDGRRGYIYHAAVAQNQQNTGIGSMLVEATLQALVKEGIHKVALVAFRHNEIGNAFWEKRGFLYREDLCYRNKALVTLERVDT